MLRTMLWTYLYGGEVYTSLILKEIIVSAVIALLLLCLYWVFKRIIFYGINDDFNHAKYGALVLSVSLALTWLIASLNLLGFWSSIIALALLGFSFMVDMIYLMVTRNR